MQTIQPGAASTTFKAEKPYMGHVQRALRSKRESDLLHKKWKSLKNQYSEIAEAIWSGYWELDRLAEQSVRHAVESGTLLFCWNGTRALEVRT